MRWSWKIGTFRGVALYLHATFLLLLGWVFLSHVLMGQGAREGLEGVGFVVLLFACVALHEFGHALTGQRFGVRTLEITLYPIGGVARLERIPRDPRQELWIALAGPAVNVAIAAVLGAALLASRSLVGTGAMAFVEGSLAARLMWMNLALALFNLLPAFPMDGGRVLRALLARQMDYTRATRAAASVGQAMAFGFGFAGLLLSPFLLLIALFVYVAAAQEAEMAETEAAFQGVPARLAMVTRFVTLAPTDPLSVAVHQLLAGSQHDFPVVRDGKVVGLLTRAALVRALGERGPDVQVAEAMLPAPATLRPTHTLDAAFRQLQEEEVAVLPVVEEGELIGLLTLENIGEFLMLRSAVSPSGRGGDPIHAREGEFEDERVPARYVLANRRGTA